MRAGQQVVSKKNATGKIGAPETGARTHGLGDERLLLDNGRGLGDGGVVVGRGGAVGM